MASQEAQQRIWTPANVVTVIRICLVPVYLVVMLAPWYLLFDDQTFGQFLQPWIAALIFVILGFTDTLDGYLARSRNEVTDFGKFLDPLADKILVAAALIALVEVQQIPSWPALVILAREFIISGVRMIAATKGEVIAASWYGKVKTVLQMCAIVLFTIEPSVACLVDQGLAHAFHVFSWVVMIAAVFMTILSLADYLYKARHLIGFEKAEGPDAEDQDIVDESQDSAPDKAELNNQITELAARIIPEATAKGLLIATAESLTGGLIAASLTAIPGSSSVVRGGGVVYCNDMKHALLGVSAQDLSEYGAVSEPVARQMCEHARKIFSADITVSVTGIAGPGSDESGLPAGTVYMGLCTALGTQVELLQFSGGREEVRLQTVLAALQAIAASL